MRDRRPGATQLTRWIRRAFLIRLFQRGRRQPGRLGRAGRRWGSPIRFCCVSLEDTRNSKEVGFSEGCAPRPGRDRSRGGTRRRGGSEAVPLRGLLLWRVNAADRSLGRRRDVESAALAPRCTRGHVRVLMCRRPGTLVPFLPRPPVSSVSTTQGGGKLDHTSKHIEGNTHVGRSALGSARLQGDGCKPVTEEKIVNV